MAIANLPSQWIHSSISTCLLIDLQTDHLAPLWLPDTLRGALSTPWASIGQIRESHHWWHKAFAPQIANTCCNCPDIDSNWATTNLVQLTLISEPFAPFCQSPFTFAIVFFALLVTPKAVFWGEAFNCGAVSSEVSDSMSSTMKWHDERHMQAGYARQYGEYASSN